jgi:hypothetical protein
MVGVKSPPFPLIQLQMLQRPSKPRSKRCAARRNRASDDEIELGTVYFFFFYNFHIACAFYNYKTRARFVGI